MSAEPISGTAVAAGGLMGASVFGIATGIDYGVVFGAFAGAVFYVATAVNISRLKLIGYFFTSFIDRNLNPQKTKKAPQNGCFFNTPC
ncbi:putative holin, partial [Escherichia coli]|uniref:putative holin n=1 Tax=Escherichia coli TaxID=562 RepID=UPI001FCF1610